jgi:hypothetical protein
MSYRRRTRRGRLALRPQRGHSGTGCYSTISSKRARRNVTLPAILRAVGRPCPQQLRPGRCHQQRRRCQQHGHRPQAHTASLATSYRRRPRRAGPSSVRGIHHAEGHLVAHARALYTYGGTAMRSGSAAPHYNAGRRPCLSCEGSRPAARRAAVAQRLRSKDSLSRAPHCARSARKSGSTATQMTPMIRHPNVSNATPRCAARPAVRAHTRPNKAAFFRVFTAAPGIPLITAAALGQRCVEATMRAEAGINLCRVVELAL